MPGDAFTKTLDLYYGSDMEASVGLAGQSTGLTDGIKPAAQIIEEIVEQSFEIAIDLGRLGQARGFCIATLNGMV